MVYPKQVAQNVSPVASDNKPETTVGCRMTVERVLFVDRAVQVVRGGLLRLDYSRADFISDTILNRASEILGEPIPVAA